MLGVEGYQPATPSPSQERKNRCNYEASPSAPGGRDPGEVAVEAPGGGKKKKGKRGLRDGTRPVAASSTRLTSLRGAGAAAGMLSSFINSGAQTARVRRGRNLPGWICEPASSKKERGKNKITHGSISPGACKAHVRVAGGQMSITAGDCKAQPHGFKASYPTLPLLLVCCLKAARRLCRHWMAANN